MKKLLLLSAFILVSSSWSIAQTEQSSAKPPSGLSEIEAYSIYYENYRSDSYESAVKFGRWIWKGMPETIKGYPRFDLKKNLRRLINAYSGLAENKQDPSLKEAYVDTAIIIFDKVFERFSDEELDKYDWYIKRGRLYQTHSSVIDNAGMLASEDYLKAFKLKPDEFPSHGDGYYIKVMLQELVSAGKKDQALAVIKQAEPHASPSLQSYFDDMRNKLFDSPEERMAFLEEQRKDNPDDEKILNQLKDLYQEQEMAQKASEVSQKLYELNPNYENTMSIADDAISNADYNTAIKYLKEAMDKAAEDQQKAQIAFKISKAYLNKEQLQSARRYARQASNYDSSWGKPYIQIADIYAQAISQCTSNENREMDRKDKVVYWLVLDYLDKAKRTDPNTSSEVKRKYDSYSTVTPTTEEKFFWQPPLKEGNKFKIDASLRECYGWINETTTVR